MKQSSILNLLSLVASVTARVPEIIESFATLDTRALPEPGCADFYGDDQHVRLYSGGMVFEMFIPTNGSNYNIGKPFARLNCNEISSSSQIRDPVCAECWDKMNYVEILTPGSCSFALTDNDNKMFSMESDHTKGKNPFPLAGYLALVTCRKSDAKAVRDIADTQLSCVETYGSNVTIWTGSSEYILHVPANESVFDLIGPDSKLGCIGPIGQKYAICQACNFPVQTLTLSAATGTCAFNFSGYADLVYHDYRYGTLSLPSSTQLWSVQCGFGHLPVDSRDMLSGKQSAPVACPAWADKTTIHLVEQGTGVKFDIELRPDGSIFQIGQPPYSVGCLRRDKLYTDQCFPCTMVFVTFEIEHVNCIFQSIGLDGRIREESWYGPLKWKYTTTEDPGRRLSTIQCHRKPVGGKRTLQALNTNNVALLVEATTQNLEQRDPPDCSISTFGVTLNTTLGTQSYLPVPANMLYYNLAGSSPNLGCYFLEHSSRPCHSCYDYEWMSMLPSRNLEECRFKLEGWEELLVWPADDREVMYFDPPIRLLGIQCGFGHENNPPAIEVRSSHLPQERDHDTLQPQGVHDDQADTVADSYHCSCMEEETDSRLTGSQCQSSGYKVSIQTANGNTYFAPVPLDYQFHPMAEMFCARLDGACVPCNEIGAAVNVSTEIQWGPCIFFSEDHRQFFTQYWDPLPDGSKMTPLTPIDPGAVISGIECGSGA